jgi:RsiW-degrading membrane proteinase PrsW (M82 family)
MFVYATVFICAYVFAMLVYRYDMYDKEPWYMLLLVAVLGIAAAFGIGFAEDSAIEFFNQYESAGGQAAIAAVFEESSKLLIVVLVAIFFRQHFNDPIDGLVYGAYAGLGFAIHESMFYLGLTTIDPQQSGTEAVRLLLHLLLGGLAGFGLGLARFPKRMPWWPVVLPCGVVTAMGLHFLWDYWCGIPRDGISEVFQRSAAVGLILVATALFGMSVSLGVRRSRAVFSPRDNRHLWGWPFSLLFRRNG